MWLGFQKTLTLPSKVASPRAMNGTYTTSDNDSGIDHTNMKLTFGDNEDSPPQDGPQAPWASCAALQLDGFMLPPAAGDH